MRLVRLEQYFIGNTSPSRKYVYKADNNIKKGDLVSGYNYVGIVIEDNVKPNMSDSRYKDTHPCNKEEAFKILKEGYLAQGEYESVREWDRIYRCGGYDDPNFGWVSVSEMDDYEDDIEEDPQQQEWAEKWANNILKKWGV